MLAALKPIKRQGWWKGKFALFWRPATAGVAGGGGGGLPALTIRGKSFSRGVSGLYRQREGGGYVQKQHRQH